MTSTYNSNHREKDDPAETRGNGVSRALDEEKMHIVVTEGKQAEAARAATHDGRTARFSRSLAVAGSGRVLGGCGAPEALTAQGCGGTAGCFCRGRAARAKVTQTWDLDSKSPASELGGYVMRGCAWQRQPGRGKAGKTAGSSWSHPPTPGALSALQGRTRVLPSVLKKNLPKEQRFLSACRGGACV